MTDESEEKSMAEVMGDDAINETEDPKAITRSIHMETRYAIVTVTTQDKDEDIQMVRKIAEELMDKYKE